MEFTVSKPTHDTVNKYYKLVIISPPVFVTEGEGLSTKEIDFGGHNAHKLNDFIDVFLEKASQYFSKPLDKTLFLQRLGHKYSTGEDALDGKSIKKISWVPAYVLFYMTKYEINWRLEDFEVVNISPGTALQESDVQDISKEEPPKHMLPPESLQRRVRRKIREARIRCGFAKLHLERLIERYYSKYGHFDGLNGDDSELSSEGE
jgi:hypothetical protein